MQKILNWKIELFIWMRKIICEYRRCNGNIDVCLALNCAESYLESIFLFLIILQIYHQFGQKDNLLLNYYGKCMFKYHKNPKMMHIMDDS